MKKQGKTREVTVKGTRGKDKTTSRGPDQLRKRAEEIVRKRIGEKEPEKLSAAEARRLVHELQVHQVELEMQNEELRLSQTMLEESRSKYADLYDFAPVGYFTLDRNGVILDANLTVAALLDVERSGLIGKPFTLFITRESQDAFFLHRKRVMTREEPQTCELQLKSKDGSERFAEIESIPVEGNTIRAAVIDVTKRKRAEDALVESEEKYRAIFTQARDGIVLMDFDTGAIVSCNAEYERQTGRKLDELREMKIWELRPGELIAVAKKKFEEVKRKGGLSSSDLGYLRPDGGIAPVEFSSKVVTIAGKKYIQGITRDITERKMAEEAVRESERKYRGLFENMLDAFSYHLMIVDDKRRPVDYLFLEVNDAFEEMTGLKKKDILGKTVTEVIPDIKDSAFDWIGEYGKVALEGKELRTEQYSEALGRWYAVSAYSPMEGYFAVVFEDITERKRSEIELQEKQKLIENIAETTPSIIYIFNLLNHDLVYANIALGSQLGYEVDDIKRLGESVYESLVHPDDLEDIEEIIRRLLKARDGEIIEMEIRVRNAQGDWRWIAARNVVFSRTENGETKEILGTARDITEHKEIQEQLREYQIGLEHIVEQRTSEVLKLNTELESEVSVRRHAEEELRLNYESLRQSNELLEKVFSSVHLCIAYLDREFNFIRVNRAYALANEKEPYFFEGKNHFDLYPHEENERIFRNTVETGKPYLVFEKAFEFPEHPEWGITYWDWSLNPVKDASGIVQGLVLSLLDVTKKKKAEFDSIMATHLASIGELAAGVAHEINNPINGIINYAQILLDDPANRDQVVEISEKLLREGGRIENIVKGLLTYSRSKYKEYKPVSIAEIIDYSFTTMDSYVKKDSIHVETHVPGDLPDIVADRMLIIQVFINLINNARYALDHKYPGSHPDKILGISAHKKVEDHRTWVEVEFYDHGMGIPTDRLGSVMKPFYSTKPPGKGTGLGLSISHNIIKDHGGKIWIESVEGEYTKVVVDLPAVEVDAARKG
jgi:PAS domain S-box-containing protein